MGKAVGGKTSVGCGVFGFISLLLGVGLTVWLGSMALSGDDDDGPGKPLIGASTPTVGITEPEGAAISIAAPPELGDGTTTATVRAVKLEPGQVLLISCLAHDEPGVFTRCDGGGAQEVKVAPDGSLDVSHPIKRVITVEAKDYDCAAAPGACVLMALRAENPDETGATTPLKFAAGLPAVDAATPPTG